MAIPGLSRLFRLVVRPPTVEQEIDAEIEFHLDEETRALVARGMAPDAARLEAQRRFGDQRETRARLARLDRERRMKRRRAGIFEDFSQDLEYALRGFRRAPGFAALVIVTLGLGIGANATMFGVVDRLLLRPPNYLKDSGRTSRLYLHRPSSDGSERIDNNIHYRRYLDLREQSRTLEASAAFFDDPEHIVGVGEDTRRLGVELISASFWDMFEIRPVLGRFFNESEDRAPNGSPVAVLAYDFWQSAYSGDRAVLGKQLYVGRRAHTIIGVAPAGFNGLSLSRMSVFTPITTEAADEFGNDYHLSYGVSWMEMIVRLRPEASRVAAEAELTRTYQQSRTAEGGVLPEAIARSRVQLAPVLYDRGPERSEIARVAVWLAGVSSIVLLIACANVANLLLARALRRRRELAVRVALGAGRRRLLRQLLTECTMLAVLGGAAGLALAHFGGGVLRNALLAEVDWSRVPLFDWRILLFTGTLALLTGVFTGIVPALHSARADVTVELKAGGREGSRPRTRLRTGLLVLQAALSVMLLIGSGLFVRSLHNVNALDLGYEPRQILHVATDLRGTVIPLAERASLQRRMLERARTHPGVQYAAVTFATPFWQSITEDVFVPGRDSLTGLGAFYLNRVSEDYFAATGTRILRGRGLTAGDGPEGPRVVVVSETLARRVWPGQEAMGQCVKIAVDTMPCSEVVGIAKDVRWGSLDDANRMQLYVPTSRSGRGALYVRTAGDPRQVAELLRRELQDLMPGTAFVTVRTLESTLDPVLKPWRIGATMFTLFGALALLVAAVGLYGVIAYGVAQRLHEMGVRAALGASKSALMRLVVGEGIKVTLVGIAFGSAAAYVGGRFLASLLFGVTPHDPIVFLVVATVLLAVSVVASFVPAWRAGRADPISVLRAD